MWWRSAYVGQKVVCARIPTSCSVQSRLKFVRIEVGQVYRIEEMVPDDRFEMSGVRIRVNDDDPDCNNWYCATCFRPVEPKSTETGFAIIRKILDRAPVKEDA